MPDVHARFSPSMANQLIHCPPSLIFGEQCGVEDTGSDYAREGTKAHALCEYLLRSALGEEAQCPKDIDSEMEACAEDYRDAVLELPRDFIAVEQRVSLGEYVPGCFGTSDCIVIKDDHMHVIDFKYGKGVQVEAEENAQLKCYALGAYLAFSSLFDIKEITLVIHQPRISNYSKWTLTTEALLEWAENVLKPKAELALKGEGEFSSGSWCQFCKAKNVCRKRAEEYLALAKYDFMEANCLGDDEVEEVLAKVEGLTTWANDVKDYALKKALSGHMWKNWKVVEGKANRKYKDEEAAAKAVTEAGFDPWEKKVLGITAMEKLLGKAKFKELLGDIVVRPSGKPALVLRSDKRPEITAAEAFKEDK